MNYSKTPIPTTDYRHLLLKRYFCIWDNPSRLLTRFIRPPSLWKHFDYRKVIADVDEKGSKRQNSKENKKNIVNLKVLRQLFVSFIVDKSTKQTRQSHHDLALKTLDPKTFPETGKLIRHYLEQVAT